jgi:ABC-type sugar transport system ATPase subunit
MDGTHGVSAIAHDARLRLVVDDVSKSFGDTSALRGISLEAAGGEVLGIAGPNGAGKTTLVRIIAGEDDADGGEVRLGETILSSRTVGRTVSVVHQEVQLAPNLTVLQNLLIEATPRRGRWPRATATELAMLKELGIERYAHVDVEKCSLVVQQLTEIGRVMMREDAAEVFLFDEPNSALTDAESEELFARVAKLKHEGKIVILVTHRLRELVEVSDRVVIIRDGRCAAVFEKSELSEGAVARELVVGIEEREDRNAAETANAGVDWYWSIEDWTDPRNASFSAVDLRVETGEILALVGVEGSGVRELTRSLGGIERASGRMRFEGRTGQSKIGFLPADRAQSLFPHLSVAKNLSSRLGRGDIADSIGQLRPRAITTIARRLVEQFSVRCQSVGQLIAGLSGGNQQKVAIAAALAAQPSLLVLEEPTRGVDVGSKSEIYNTLRGFAKSGGAVVALCTEVPEVFELCDRVVLIDGGRVRAALDVANFSTLTDLAERLATLAGAEV